MTTCIFFNPKMWTTDLKSSRTFDEYNNNVEDGKREGKWETPILISTNTLHYITGHADSYLGRTVSTCNHRWGWCLWRMVQFSSLLYFLVFLSLPPWTIFILPSSYLFPFVRHSFPFSFPPFYILFMAPSPSVSLYFCHLSSTAPT